ncbi:MAG: hypothetical protein CR975_06780 [Gammaproteobacteria bacterium]|nr:MAG: hypothetical protein CR975_06780 [Gammaproteobacteria bacterium]
MKKTRKKYEGIHLSKGSDSNFSLPNDAFPVLMKEGFYKQLWQSSPFLQAHQLSQFLVQSATLVKKYLPEKYHKDLRFTQSPNTWVLAVNDSETAERLSAILSQYDQFLQADNELPPFLQLRRVYRSWEKAGIPLGEISDFADKPHIQKLCQLIPDTLQAGIRLKYYPSVWQLNVANANVATRITPLLDELSLRLAKDMGFAPKLKLCVVPDNWQASGFSLIELVKPTKRVPTEAEAEAFLTDFLRSTAH